MNWSLAAGAQSKKTFWSLKFWATDSLVPTREEQSYTAVTKLHTWRGLWDVGTSRLKEVLIESRALHNRLPKSVPDDDGAIGSD